MPSGTTLGEQLARAARAGEIYSHNFVSYLHHTAYDTRCGIAGGRSRAVRAIAGFSVENMGSHVRFTLEQARAAGERIGIDWHTSPFGLEQFRMGMDVELEHGTRAPQTNVTGDDLIMTAKIARAHLNEFPDYYTRLAKMEAEAEADRAGPTE